MDWIDKNPAILMKRVKAEMKPTDYFTKDEFKAFVDATFAAHGEERSGALVCRCGRGGRNIRWARQFQPTAE
jgi:hypothetical protein